MKSRKPRPGSTSDYIQKVLRYQAQYETGQNLKQAYPPIMAELLLSLLVEVRAFLKASCLILGFLAALLLKSVFFGG